jgi:hypothetical protein
MASPTGVIPDNLMNFESRAQVVQFLMSLPIHAEDKLALYTGWCAWVGTKAGRSDRRKLQDSGI